MNKFEDPLFDKELYELSAAQAQEILRRFLELEKQKFAKIKFEGISLDYSKESVINVFYYVMNTKFKPNISNEDERNTWYARLGFYFGESLRRTSSHLKWAVGKGETAFENHPVITGFSDGTEAAVITISSNLIGAVIEDGQPATRINIAVDEWFEAARALR